MMNLIIETKDQERKGDVMNAYTEALNECNLIDFIDSLDRNIGASEIGKSGSHIWIYDTIKNERIAIITDLFN